MTTVDIRPARRRFSRRKQWRFSIASGGNNLSDRDTYANVGDILTMLKSLREGPVLIRVQYEDGVAEIRW